MNQKKEAALAGHLLLLREKGYSIARSVRQSKTSYAILFGSVAVAILLNHAGWLPRSALMLVMGSALGALARDCGWFRRSKAIWPLYTKVIDWRKVQDLAEQGTANDGAQGAPANSPR